MIPKIFQEKVFLTKITKIIISMIKVILPIKITSISKIKNK